MPVAPGHRQTEIRAAAAGQRADRGIQPFTRETGADKGEQDFAAGDAEFSARRRAQRRATPRIEMLQVHAVMDHVQLPRREPEAPPDLLAHHARVADHGAQTRMLEHAPLGRADVAVIRIELDAEALERGGRGAPDVEPFGMHAVSGAVQIATGDAFVRLHQVEVACLPGAPRGTRERSVAPQIAGVERICKQQLAPLPTRRAAWPPARNQRHFDT